MDKPQVVGALKIGNLSIIAENGRHSAIALVKFPQNSAKSSEKVKL